MILKITLVVLFLATGVSAGIQYVTPNMIVSNSPMYCTDRYGERISTYIVGDIVGGDFAKQNCSYNKSTVEQMAVHRQNTTDHEFDNAVHTILGYAIIGLIVILVVLVLGFMGIFNIIGKLFTSLGNLLQNKEK